LPPSPSVEENDVNSADIEEWIILVSSRNQNYICTEKQFMSQSRDKKLPNKKLPNRGRTTHGNV
jgi:hypothetical protein